MEDSCSWRAVMVGQHVTGHIKSNKLSNWFRSYLRGLRIHLDVTICPSPPKGPEHEFKGSGWHYTGGVLMEVIAAGLSSGPEVSTAKRDFCSGSWTICFLKSWSIKGKWSIIINYLGRWPVNAGIMCLRGQCSVREKQQQELYSLFFYQNVLVGGLLSSRCRVGPVVSHHRGAVSRTHNVVCCLRGSVGRMVTPEALLSLKRSQVIFYWIKRIYPFLSMQTLRTRTPAHCAAVVAMPLELIETW